MLFDTTLRKELARSFGGTLVVILTIVLTMMLIRTVGQAAGGVIAPEDVVLLLGYTALGHLPTMLALSLFIAVVVCLGRMYRDSEMAVWFASGIALNRFVRPVLRMSWPVLLVVALLVLFVWPWGNRQSTELRERYEQRSDLSRVAPGVFQSSRDGKSVFFIERESPESINARNVFILSTDGLRESVTSAKGGHLDNIDGDRWLVLERGQRNETDGSHRRQDAVELRALPRAGRRTFAATRRAATAQGDAYDRIAATADGHEPGRTGLAARACCSARPTWCCWASACRLPIRAAPATGTCCWRCSASSSTTT